MTLYVGVEREEFVFNKKALCDKSLSALSQNFLREMRCLGLQSPISGLSPGLSISQRGHG